MLQMSAPSVWEVQRQQEDGTVPEAIKSKPVRLLLSSGRSLLHSYLVREDFGTWCWKQCTWLLLPEGLLWVCILCSACFCLVPGAYLGQRAEHLTLPSERWASLVPAGRKNCCIWFQVLPYSRPHTSLWRFKASRIQCQGVEHLLLRANPAELISMMACSLTPPPFPPPASWCHQADFISEAAVFTAV